MSDFRDRMEAFRECPFRHREDRVEGRIGRFGHPKANQVGTRFGPYENGGAFDKLFVPVWVPELNRDFCHHV